ncbi:hypothetical protein O2W18_10610 [Modestobacter sp. VKM Ac-2983]|uniref:hypothetical protein n=1 Tax=Modestobacter sp. VKM Ac-2983 TaxID=3004137 RepID=UPI0022AB7C35|nr:hypothetical protein [Modestobacter sp. VKM Ac-2983]MCZ2805556.1 hypothetical protein [Modestobacter sp. VKM Ac-2983]
MTNPDAPGPDAGRPGAGPEQEKDAPGVEMGLSEEAGGTFEPEEDPDANGPPA